MDDLETRQPNTVETPVAPTGKLSWGGLVGILVLVLVIVGVGITGYFYTMNIGSEARQWEGAYVFTEHDAGSESGSPQMLRYTLTIVGGGDGALLHIDGFQTMVRLEGSTRERGTKLEVFFDAYGENHTGAGNFEEGDILITLEYTDKEHILVEWKKLQPIIEGTEQTVTFRRVSSGNRDESTLRVEDDADEQPAQRMEGRRFVSNIQNITFRLPPDWERVSYEALTKVPEEVADPQFSFRKRSSECAVVYAARDTQINTVQTSFADRAYSADWQFDASWYVPEHEGTRYVSFTGRNRQYLADEFRRTNVFRRRPYNFFLFTRDGSPVPDECNEDMNALLETTTYHYDRTTLDDRSDGYLWTQTEWSSVESRDEKKLLYTPTGTRQHYEVLGFGGKIKHSGRILIIDSELYYAAPSESEEGRTGTESLRVLDPLTREMGTVARSGIPSGVISSVYAHDGDVYYTTHLWEQDCFRSCDGALYRISVSQDGTQELLARPVSVHRIEGYKKDEAALYLSAGYGDAGCFSFKPYRYMNGEMQKLDAFGGCSGDDGFEDALKQMEEITTDSSYVHRVSNAARIENGRVSVPRTLPAELAETIERRDSLMEFLSWE